MNCRGSIFARKGAVFGAVLCFTLSHTACLKTRAQIKGEQGSAEIAEEAKPAKVTASQVEEIRNEVTRISGKVEELDHHQRTQNVSELKDYATRLDARVAELEKNQLLLMGEVKSLKDKTSADAAAAKEAATPVGDTLVQANQLLGEKKCDQAAEKFNLALKRKLKGKEAAEAHFGLGEALYCSKEYKKAILEYAEVQKASAASPRIPASLYKMGLAFQHLNMTKESQNFFSELIDRYPKSTEAKRARAKVKE